MKLHVVNPNGSVAMTRSIEAEAKAAALASDCEAVVTFGGPQVPETVEGYADEAAVILPMLHNIRAQEQAGARAHVIACFDDTGLDAAREVASRPVLGICAAAMDAARILSKRALVITSLDRSVPKLEELARHYGATGHLRGIYAAGIPVAELEGDSCAVLDRMLAQLETLITRDRPDMLILGCAGMSRLADALEQRLNLPVIDGLQVAIHFAAALGRSGLTTSKVGAYAFPRAKPGAPILTYTDLADFAPNSTLSHTRR